MHKGIPLLYTDKRVQMCNDPAYEAMTFQKIPLVLKHMFLRQGKGIQEVTISNIITQKKKKKKYPVFQKTVVI